MTDTTRERLARYGLGATVKDWHGRLTIYRKGDGVVVALCTLEQLCELLHLLDALRGGS